MGTVLPKTVTQASVSVGTGSTAVLPVASQHQRTFVLIQNDSDNPIYLAFGQAAVVGQGVLLNSRGSNLQISDQVMLTNQAINAISAVGGSNLLVLSC